MQQTSTIRLWLNVTKASVDATSLNGDAVREQFQKLHKQKVIQQQRCFKTTMIWLLFPIRDLALHDIELVHRQECHPIPPINSEKKLKIILIKINDNSKKHTVL